MCLKTEVNECKGKNINEVTTTSDVLKSNPLAFVVSDVHLGAYNEIHAKFLEWIQIIVGKLEGGELTNLKYFIMCGDIFDILFDCPNGIVNTPQTSIDIYDNMNKLTAKGIRIINTMGNHEFSLWSPYGHQKKKYLKEMSKAFTDSTVSSCDFFKKENICQYAALEVFEDGTNVLKTFDYKCKMRRNKPNYPSENVNGSISESILFCHGHQFPYIISKFQGLVNWSPLLRMPYVIKDFVDFFFCFMKGPITNDTIDDAFEKWRDGKTPEELDTLNKFLGDENKGFHKFLMKFEKTDVKRHSLTEGLRRKVITNIMRFIGKRQTTQVVFGHTHELFKCQQTKKNGENLWIANTGSWQGTDFGGYGEISTTGEVTIYRFKF